MAQRKISESEPLSPEERKRLVDALSDASLVTRFAVLGSLYTGLTPAELCHIKSNLLRERGGTTVVLASGKVECDVYSGSNSLTKWSPRDGKQTGDPCSVERCDGTFAFDRSPVPIKHRPTLEMFDHFFDLHDVTPTFDIIQMRVQKIGEACGIDRLNTLVLRYTYPVILAEHGFNRDDIADVLSLAEGTKENINFSEDIGPYCRGSNPFICDESGCDRPSRTGEKQCNSHFGAQGIGGNAPRCGELLDDGTRCSLPVPDPYELCHWHSADKETNTCGVELADGTCCETIVSGPEDRCVHHSNDNAVCGGETESGGRCTRIPKSGQDRCFNHQEQPRCGAETSAAGAAGEQCTRRVKLPDEKCWQHTNSE